MDDVNIDDVEAVQFLAEFSATLCASAVNSLPVNRRGAENAEDAEKIRMILTSVAPLALYRLAMRVHRLLAGVE